MLFGNYKKKRNKRFSMYSRGEWMCFCWSDLLPEVQHPKLVQIVEAGFDDPPPEITSIQIDHSCGGKKTTRVRRRPRTLVGFPQPLVRTQREPSGTVCLSTHSFIHWRINRYRSSFWESQVLLIERY